MKKYGTGWIWGLLFILVGTSYLLSAMGVSDAHSLIVQWWPILLILIGVVTVIENNIFSGLSWILIGAIILVFTTGAVHYNGDIWAIIWPVIFIWLGLRFMFRSAFRVKVTTEDKDWGDVSAVFAGTNRKISSQNFTGTAVRAAFGGAKLDLRGVKIAEGGAIIDVSAAFGGVEILVPKKTPVRTDIVSVFGGHEDKRDMDEIDENLPAITIKGEAIFGGVEIKN